MTDHPVVFDTPRTVREWSIAHDRAGRTIALVPTMGALHAGHLTLIDRAREHADVVVVSIFVNPLQFGESADFDHYPRPIDDDIAQCRRHGVEAIYAPTAATMYPTGFETHVVAGALADTMEGATRPGHFDGVLTVVTKLFAAVRPDVAMFGEKDFQQLAIVRRLAVDLDLGVDVIGVPTVREPDGLAMSSRNLRLDAAQRVAARCVPRAIDAAVRRAADPTAHLGEVIAAAESVIGSEPMAELIYVTVFDPHTLAPLRTLDGERQSGPARIALAVRFGDIRLIDNAELVGGSDPGRFELG